MWWKIIRPLLHQATHVMNERRLFLVRSSDRIPQTVVFAFSASAERLSPFTSSALQGEGHPSLEAMHQTPARRWLIYCVLFLCYPGEMAEFGEAARPVATQVQSPAEGEFAECPLNLASVNSHPWMVRKCSEIEKTQCCDGITDIIRILLFSWLHKTGSFVLPDNRTAALCWDAFQQKLQSLKVLAEVFDGCRIRPTNLFHGYDSCQHIENKSSFEIAVNASGIQRYCKASGAEFECSRCWNSMSAAVSELQNKGSGGTTWCDLFVRMYVGGGINYYEDLGPNAAYCLLSAQISATGPQAAGSGSSAQNRHKSATAVKIGLGIAIPAGITILLLILHACFKWRRMNPRSRRLRSIKSMKRRADLFRESMGGSTGLRFFDLSEIKASTGNFHSDNMVGEGGFSTVYRGTLSDGTQIAVKRFKHSTAEGEEEFRHEVQVISSVRHRNLLPLRGYCIGRAEQGEAEQLLVYDFMSNGSLADYLFRGNRPCLAWADRLKIAVGIAKGLAYLHQDAKPSIIHRDVKAANVLLDQDLNPLVADFGLAKFKQDADKTHYTTRAVGTLGYVAPEYALYGHLTDKSDVFSFGILLLELMSGRKVLASGCGNPEHVVISDWACDLIRTGRSTEVIDERIRDSGPKDIMQRVILLGLQCAHPKVASRPSIAQAQLILESIDHPLPDIISMSFTEFSTDESLQKKKEELEWLVAPDMDSRALSYGSMTLGSMSLSSYSSGR